jgi:hypothetical protein
VSNIFLVYVGWPLGITGISLIWGTVLMTWLKGPHTGDSLRITAGILAIITANIFFFISNLLTHDWIGAGSDVFWIAFIITTNFRKPRQRKKIRKLIGNKAKAVKARISKRLKNARDRMPRPSLRPIPVPS